MAVKGVMHNQEKTYSPQYRCWKSAGVLWGGGSSLRSTEGRYWGGWLYSLLTFQFHQFKIEIITLLQYMCWECSDQGWDTACWGCQCQQLWWRQWPVWVYRRWPTGTGYILTMCPNSTERKIVKIQVKMLVIQCLELAPVFLPTTHCGIQTLIV